MLRESRSDIRAVVVAAIDRQQQDQKGMLVREAEAEGARAPDLTRGGPLQSHSIGPQYL